MLYGQSVGSGPTVYLAAVTEGIAGLILHSALASGPPPPVLHCWAARLEAIGFFV